MKIAVIGAKGLPSRISGLEVYVNNVCTGLAADFEITVFVRKRYCDEIVKRYKGVRIVHIPSINTKHLDAVSYSFFATIAAIFGGYDIFWYQALGPAVTAFLPKLFGKKILSTVHGLDWKREKFGKLASYVLKKGEKAIAKYADGIIVLNESDADYFLKTWKRKAYVIPNGVKAAHYAAAKSITGKYRIKKGEYFLFLSRLVPEKNVHCLIRAFQKLETDKKLMIAGKGVHTSLYENEVRKMARNSENIQFAGYVEGTLLEELYSNAYAYILPSTIEGQSIGLLEAMSYGLPCIVSDIPENTGVIGDAGLSFASNDVEALKDRLKFAIDHPKELRVMGAKAREVALKEHDWEKTIRCTKEVIDRCI